MAGTILFLCTGNYYRSRYAEVVFNDLAARAGLAWRAESRGLAVDKGGCNVGPLSRFAMERMSARGILPAGVARMPQQVCETELAAVEVVIALKEAEHRPYLAARYPDWPDRVRYWHIHDLDAATADDALPEIDAHVAALVREISERGTGEGAVTGADIPLSK